jgi:hypothetical protein
LSTPSCLKGIFLCTWLYDAFSSSTAVSNHLLYLLQYGEPLLYLQHSCSSVELSAATNQCTHTYSKHTNLTSTDECPVTFLCMLKFTTKRFLSMCQENMRCSTSIVHFHAVVVWSLPMVSLSSAW